MPELLDLANELLLQIIENTHVEDIDSFSSCNKRIRLFFGSTLQLHTERKRKYSKLELGSSWTVDPSLLPTRLLCGILETPIIARYPKEVIISNFVFRAPTHSRPTCIDQWEEELSAKLERCPYVRSTSVRDSKSEILKGNEGTTIAFLFVLLPNIKSVGITTGLVHYSLFNEVVSDIAAASPGRTEMVQPLQKLTTVCLNTYPTVGDYNILVPFCKLRSRQKLKVRGVFVLGDDWNRNDSKQCESDNKGKAEDEEENMLKEKDGSRDTGDVEHKDEHEDEHGHKTDVLQTGITCMSFQHSAINSQSFSVMLENTNALRSFKYDYDPDISSYGPALWEPAAILRNLVFYAGHSLVTLTLFGICVKGPWNCSVGNSPSSANPLQNFQKLKRLCVQDGIFVEALDIQEYSTLTNQERGSWSTNLKYHQMVDTLPQSLEQLVLLSSFDDESETMSAFEGFPELKQSRLPR